MLKELTRRDITQFEISLAVGHLVLGAHVILTFRGHGVELVLHRFLRGGKSNLISMHHHELLALVIEVEVVLNCNPMLLQTSTSPSATSMSVAASYLCLRL